MKKHLAMRDQRQLYIDIQDKGTSVIASYCACVMMHDGTCVINHVFRYSTPSPVTKMSDGCMTDLLYIWKTAYNLSMVFLRFYFTHMQLPF